ncbi:glutathione S-transferase [Anopheles sinensis]|uniref:Glutathione S-transferase n=1 Tax=Anopheles sinensis TaxID=74873 RepID=A0A084VJ62_ANOSI|nr:glutathione S-transferase [Anopheles sinensis]
MPESTARWKGTGREKGISVAGPMAGQLMFAQYGPEQIDQSITRRSSMEELDREGGAVASGSVEQES